MEDNYRPGDPWCICQRSGFKVRRSETVKEWTGLRVARRFADERNPQDFVKARAERINLRDAQPEPPDVFIEPGDVTLDDFDYGFGYRFS